MRTRPPKKQQGDQRGPRRINGRRAMDVDTFAAEEGFTPKAVRSGIARGLIPFRRYGGRVIVLRDEWEQFLAALPGVTAAEALVNVKAREGAR